MNSAPPDVALPPVRGLLALNNARGQPFDETTIARWLRLSVVVLKTPKLDLDADASAFHRVGSVLEAAALLDARISLRTASRPPDGLAAWRDAGLLDALLLWNPDDLALLERWAGACREAGMPLRVRLLAPPHRGAGARAAEAVRQAGVALVTMGLSDPLAAALPGRPAANGPDGQASLKAFAETLAGSGTDLRWEGVPFCAVPETLRAAVVNAAQAARLPQGYQPEAADLARRLYVRSDRHARLAVTLLLGRHTSYPNPIDARLLPWLLDWPWVRARIWAWHKLTRYVRLPGSAPEPVAPRGQDAPGAPPARHAACRTCAVRRICDQYPLPARAAMPGLTLEALPGEPLADPLAFRREPGYLDAVDRDRADAPVTGAELAGEARHRLEQVRPDREAGPFDYEVEGHWSKQAPGIVRWFSWTATEKRSTPVATLEPPFTIAAAFGGGIAEYAGFAVGRDARLVCPMTAFHHRIALHCAADGRYVLLRDGVPVRPVDFQGAHYVPPRIPGRVPVRLSLWNIDGEIGTQGVSIWEGEPARTQPAGARFSVVVVCTRFSRRLQAALLAVAHQQGIALDAVEVLTAYVPGLDATGDVLDSLETAFPALQVVRVPVPGERATAKGFMINEAVRLARGDWVLLMDADILLAPGTLARLAELPPDARFAVPDGRKMLPPETTADVLLGRLTPWEDWDALLSGPGEYRRAEADGVPLGFCQWARRECFERVSYEELNTFEGADWRFGRDMREAFGRETRLTGLPVLHLDHGGSQWYGTPQHR